MPRIYIYKITFEEVPYYYYGVHKEKRYNEYYMGSPKTHKWCWEFYTPKKQILEIFPYTDEGWLEAQEVEKRLIKLFYNEDKWCLNESCGGIFSLEICKNNGKTSYELKTGLHKYEKNERIDISRKGGMVMGNRHKENGTGIFSMTEEEKIEAKRKGGMVMGPKSKLNKTGIFSMTEEEKIEAKRKGGMVMGNKHKKNGTGIFSMTEEEKIEAGKKGGTRSYELGLGVHSLTTEQRRENVKRTNSQKWMCLKTGYISTPAGLSRYQKARNIDTCNRIRIE